jgi:competence protein ComEA
MKRLLVFGAVVVAVLLALWHPAPPATIAAVAAAVPVRRSPSISLRMTTTTTANVVYVVGAVVRPGLYRLGAGARINDAVERAGGLRADADPAAVNLAERVSDGEEIHVLRLGETAPAPVRRTRAKRKTISRAAAQAAPIDVNGADESALASIPGIGATLAARIVAYRRLNGPFASLDELADVAGMTPRRIDALTPYVTVGSQ